MATLKNRLEALEARTPAGAGHFCLVLHGKGDCTQAREEAIANYALLHGCEPVNFINIFFIGAGDTGRACKCSEGGATPFTVTGPDARGIMTDILKETDGTSLPVVRDLVQ